MQRSIQVAHSLATNPVQAVREFHAGVAQPNAALVLFFCSSSYDLNVVAQEINRLFPDSRVVGCTTAGEIGPAGCREGSLVGVSFSADTFTAATGYVDQLGQFQITRGHSLATHLLQELEESAPQMHAQNSFAITLIDGLSVREEPVARALQNALGAIPLVGGSAGDGLNFAVTHVFADGAFRSGSAVLAVVTTLSPVRVFKTQHFVPTDQRLVITEADSARRIVKEINGYPAATEYARLLGVNVSDLNPGRFAVSPVVVLIDGNNYVRSIQRIEDDGSIRFYCAIEQGLVLRVARGVDIVENLEHAFTEMRHEIGSPELVLCFDCILRRLEIVHAGLESRMGSIFQENRAIGFNTYGEQFKGVHVNQTLTAVALGGATDGLNA